MIGTTNMSNNIKERQGSRNTDVGTSNAEEIKNKGFPRNGVMKPPCMAGLIIAFYALFWRLQWVGEWLG